MKIDFSSSWQVKIHSMLHQPNLCSGTNSQSFTEKESSSGIINGSIFPKCQNKQTVLNSCLAVCRKGGGTYRLAALYAAKSLCNSQVRVSHFPWSQTRDSAHIWNASLYFVAQVLTTDPHLIDGLIYLYSMLLLTWKVNFFKYLAYNDSYTISIYSYMIFCNKMDKLPATKRKYKQHLYNCSQGEPYSKFIS